MVIFRRSVIRRRGISWCRFTEALPGPHGFKSNSRNVRQILGRPGELWLPESGADKLVVIRE